MPISQWVMNADRLKLYVPDMENAYNSYLKVITESGEINSPDEGTRNDVRDLLARYEANMLSAKIALKSLLPEIEKGNFSATVTVRPTVQSGDEARTLLKEYANAGYTVSSLNLMTKESIDVAKKAQQDAEEAKRVAALAQQEADRQAQLKILADQQAQAKIKEAEALAAQNAEKAASLKLAEAQAIKDDANASIVAAKNVAIVATNNAEIAKQVAVNATVSANVALDASGGKVVTNKALLYGVGALALLFLLRR